MEYYTDVQNYLEAHAQDGGFQDDLSSSLTTERIGWVRLLEYDHSLAKKQQ
jgi:hypothetical protein